MHFRSVLSGTLALLLLSAGATLANGTGQSTDSGFSFHLPGVELPSLFGSKKQPADQVQMAQSNSGGMTGLEDQLRQMNGKIEELNFQILQMQEQMRKQQEDNEFRFQQLEGGSQGKPASGQKKSDASSDTNRSVAEAPAAPADNGGGQPADSQSSGDQTATDQSGGGQSIQDVIVESSNGDPGKVIPGTPPKTFGTITVDK
ncbi:MAG: tol-pal system protein YbgF, partial [Mesorhizobium sp.]|nr:tol-pal system protein YbgF [Mesorhizobium sp.]